MRERERERVGQCVVLLFAGVSAQWVVHQFATGCANIQQVLFGCLALNVEYCLLSVVCCM